MVLSSPLFARLLGDPVRAGDLYYQKGRLAKAASCYGKAGRFEQASKVAVEMGDTELAIGYLLEAGEHRGVGELLAREGRHREALTHFDKARAWLLAAKACLQLGLAERAGYYYQKAGHLESAADSFEKGGNVAEALNVLQRESSRLEQRVRQSGDPRDRDRKRKVDLRLAGHLAQLKRHTEAAELLLSWGQRRRAAELFQAAGEIDRAARAYLEADEADRAAALLDRTQELGPRERAEIYRRSNRYREAANEFQAAQMPAEAAECLEADQDWQGAAEQWEAAYETIRAAELYFRAGAWRDAARCFSTGGRLDLAARAYLEIPDPGSAASCFAQVGEHLEAGRHFLEAGDRASAIDALQQVPRESTGFGSATLLLVPLLVEDGIYDGALARIQMLDPAAANDDEAVERWYWEARSEEGRGRASEARSLYERVAALRRGHRDVTGRLATLRSDTGSSSGPVSMHTPAPAGRGEPMVLEPGAILAHRYHLEAEIGRGGMGRVYRARDLELEERVAIKTVLSRADDSTADQERLLRELQICRRITHPNVVRVYDMGRFAGGIFVTMEHLEGETLDQLARREGQLALEPLKGILRDTLAALVVAHEQRVVHRDLKPSNIFLTKAGRLKVLDFGIARMEGADVELTTAGEVLGSPKYMSPEQIKGETLDGRTDLYSLGIIAFALLAGREPFRGKTPSHIAVKQLKEPPPDILGLRPDLPAPWVELLERMMAKSPGERYGTAAEAASVVDELPVD